ncbi:MAG TPA: acyl-CoA dehydrogenase [Mycobacterium sp.]|nr:acyl-CoA dehydrogenase [Mycobacterium sp.]
MIAGLIGRWLAAGELELPLPGSGATAQRWRRLAALAQDDLVAGRLAEAYTDAVAILAELGGPDPKPDQLWGVWAAESRGAMLRARTENGEATLDGVKVWCSGVSLCTHALVTARLDSGERGLFAVELSRTRALPSTWRNPGMAETDTRSVGFDGVPAVAVGAPGEYLTRPGFWHGAIGVSACWLGGAGAVAEPLYAAAADASPDPHTLAHLGAVDAALAAAKALLTSAAAEVDRDPLDVSGTAELLARRARPVVETAVDEAITRTGRALGPAPLCLDADHARRVADLTVYVRQSHAERDLHRLGELAGAAR